MLDDSITEAARKKIVQQSLLKREGSPEDVAAAVQFLVESPFITGVCLPVDGGRTIFAGNCDDVVAHPTYDRDK
jgi:pteridine reductase